MPFGNVAVAWMDQFGMEWRIELMSGKRRDRIIDLRDPSVQCLVAAWGTKKVGTTQTNKQKHVTGVVAHHGDSVLRRL
jgi:hypothetical protein